MTVLSFLPENAIVESNGDIRTTSLKVAEAFGKRHDNILRSLNNLECSAEFNALNFEEVDYLDQKGQFRKAYQMTKDGFMFLVMGFTGKKAAQIKEAYINAFNHMAGQLLSRMPTLPPSQYRLPANRLPNVYDSGWIPAHYERCAAASHWTYHIKFAVRQKGGKYSASFELGVGGKDETKPWFSSSGAEFIDSGFFLEYRDLEELWENIRKVLEKYNAHSPF